MPESALVEEIRAKKDAAQAGRDAAEDRRVLGQRDRQQGSEARQEQELEDADQAELDSKRLRIVQRPPKLDVVNDGAGFLLSLVGYALLLNYIRGGIPAVRGWFAAKFLNIPYKGELNNLGPATPATADAPGQAPPARAYVTRRVT